MNIKILVCDDDSDFVAYMITWLNQHTPPFCQLSVHGETDPANLTEEDLSTCDIAFLDVDMKTINGIDVAKRMRALQSKVILIFITNYIEYSPEGYEVQAFRFLMKGQLPEKLPRYFAESIQELQRQNRTLSVSLNRELLNVNISELTYLQSENRKVHLYTINHQQEHLCFYETLDHLEQQLAEFGFLRVHKSYLVNMNYICKLKYDQIQMSDGTILPVSERRYSSIREKYLNWKVYQK